MSQFDLQAIIQQQQEQLVAMQTQIQALLEEGAEGEAVVKSGGGATEMAKPQNFDGTLSKVTEFIMVYKLYIKMKLRKESVEEQVQWVLSYIQGEQQMCGKKM